LLEFVQQLPAQMPLLVLISGGTSALLEVLPPGVTLADLQRVNDWLLASGSGIAVMNRIRKSLSCVKGGGLCGYLGARPVLNLMISDVRDDDPSVIGSGLLSPGGVAEPGLPALPAWLEGLLDSASACPRQSSTSKIEQQVIAGNRDACQAAAQTARSMQLPVQVHSPIFDPMPQAVSRIAQRLLTAEAGVHIWGGETTLVLPENPGQGGRNQHLALSLAQALRGHAEITVLCGATDGSDGPTDDAGAVVDGLTVLEEADYPGGATRALARADSGHYLAEAGALISTGPTGTNVMDLVMAIKQPA
jgi:hydroxypyruvate reductase